MCEIEVVAFGAVVDEVAFGFCCAVVAGSCRVGVGDFDVDAEAAGVGVDVDVADRIG